MLGRRAQRHRVMGHGPFGRKNHRPRHRRRLLDLLSVSISEAPGKPALLKAFDERLAHAGSHPRHALQLVDDSFNNYRTIMYDKYQKKRNNIAA